MAIPSIEESLALTKPLVKPESLKDWEEFVRDKKNPLSARILEHVVKAMLVINWGWTKDYYLSITQNECGLVKETVSAILGIFLLEDNKTEKISK